MNGIEPKPGFDWSRVRWDAPNDRQSDNCSYCDVAIPESDVPLRLWTEDGHACVFCRACSRTWWGMESFDDVDADLDTFADTFDDDDENDR